MLSTLMALAVAALIGLVGTAPAAVAAPAPPRPEIVVETAHVRLLGADDARPSIARLAAVADEHFGRVCRQLGACQALDGPVDVWIAEDPVRFAAAFADHAPMAEWAAGVAFVGARRVVLRAHGSALFSLVETFDHELAHVLLHAVAGDRRVPRWLSEGLAIWASGEDVVGRLDAAHRAALTGSLIPLPDLDRRFPDHGPRVSLAYAQSALFTRFIIQRHGPHALPALLLDVARGVPFDRAFERRFGAPAAALADEWSGGLEDDTSVFMLLHDGSVLWVLMTMLFLLAALVRSRERKAEMARLDDEDLVDEAVAELAARCDGADPPTLH